MNWTSRDEFYFRQRFGNLQDLEKDVLLAGMLDHIEIWNEERWKRKC